MSNLTSFDNQSINDADAIYLVNVVQVNEGLQDRAIAILKDTVEYVSENYPAFRWSRLLKSVDGKTVINQAQWSSRSAFEKLFSDEDFLSRYSQLKETGTWEYHLYKVDEYIQLKASAGEPV
ncbi:antibiotic biosynthesis monooxygenase family protein [Candidatus Pantoea multigeneris]|nr:antibiotic biosynthesis monooxygenase [Pantoea multigeneris]